MAVGFRWPGSGVGKCDGVDEDLTLRRGNGSDELNGVGATVQEPLQFAVDLRTGGIGGRKVNPILDDDQVFTWSNDASGGENESGGCHTKPREVKRVV